MVAPEALNEWLDEVRGVNRRVHGVVECLCGEVEVMLKEQPHLKLLSQNLLSTIPSFETSLRIPSKTINLSKIRFILKTLQDLLSYCSDCFFLSRVLNSSEPDLLGRFDGTLSV